LVVAYKVKLVGLFLVKLGCDFFHVWFKVLGDHGYSFIGGKAFDCSPKLSNDKVFSV